MTNGPKLPCPVCSCEQSHVRETKILEFNGVKVIRRRRICHDCGDGFTTHEQTVKLRRGRRPDDTATLPVGSQTLSAAQAGRAWPSTRGPYHRR